jgi:D-threonate/D-erythronate kinase
MIAVIADDFTGAAEIGGIGLRHGLNVVIATTMVQHIDIDLLIIATDTRSLQANEASGAIGGITRQLLELKPLFIYKKIDSVLRGNIAEELKAQMDASGKDRAIVIAANPVFKRMIRKGIYYIDNIPLHETNFSSDPEYPVWSSSVKEIVGDTSIADLRSDDVLPEQGLIIGDVNDKEDLGKWAAKIDGKTLPAGASGFFEALVMKYVIHKSAHTGTTPPPFGEKALYVLGSAFPKEEGMLDKIGHYVSNMPGELYFNREFVPGYLEDWADDIVRGIREYKKVVASVVHPPSDAADIAFRVREITGKLVKRVLEKTEINELIIEGGGTTSVVLKYLNISKLVPMQELKTGVIRMSIEGRPGLCLTTKPGSYLWPDDIWLLQTASSMKKIVT